ncbi:MAG: hypothetical protein U0103_01920 [Candidatus Obscuribacterales bacterium]
MWSDEQVQDAVAVLWNASELGPIQKVKATDEKDEKREDYIVAGEVTYTDPIYLKAFENLLSEGKLAEQDSQSEEADRKSYGRCEKSCSETKKH